MAKKWTGERLETFVYNESTIEHLHRYAIAMHYAKNKVVLDIACGEGYGTNLLSDIAQRVIGVDNDETTISNARKKYTRQNIEFIKAQAEKLPLADKLFDIVVSFETLEHTNEHAKMLGEIKRVLKPGGILIISTPDKKNYSDLTGYNNPFHLKELYEHEFTDLLNRFFLFAYCFYQALTVSSIVLTKEEGRLKIYEGNYNKVITNDNIKPMYLVAIASDQEITKPSSSLFLGNSILQTAMEKKEKELKTTVSYKIGHFILFPAKLIRNIFKK